MKIIYTKAAQQELLSFHEKQQRLLEEIVTARKFVYGDEAVEITASDIKEAAAQIRAIRPSSSRKNPLRLASQVYFILGVGTMICAYFYPKLKTMIVEDRTQAMIFIAGALMSLVGLVASVFYRFRLQRYEEEVQHYQTEAERLTSDIWTLAEDIKKKDITK